MVIYYSAYEYLESSTEDLDRINKLKAIITAYEDALLASATTAHYLEYSLDDGQSKIKTGYRSAKEFMNGLMAMDLMLQRLIVRYNRNCMGSMARLVDSKNFKRYRNGFF